MQKHTKSRPLRHNFENKRTKDYQMRMILVYKLLKTKENVSHVQKRCLSISTQTHIQNSSKKKYASFFCPFIYFFYFYFLLSYIKYKHNTIT
jgi:hypothetical protein